MPPTESRQSSSGERWRAQAMRLRAQGLSVRAIAEAVGKSKSTVGALLTPSLCDCGTPKVHHAMRCDSCRRKDEKWRQERIDELVAGMFDDGWPLKEIADVLGRTVGTPCRAGAAIGPELDRARARGLVKTTRVRTGWGTWAPA